MRKKDYSFRFEDYKLIQQLNFDRTVFIAEQIKSTKKYVMKIINLNFVQNLQKQYERINKLMTNNHNNVLKPELFCFQIQKNITKLCLLHPRYPISLQKILLLHKTKGVYFSKKFIGQFSTKMYNIISKLKEQNFYHGNIKPSNIFYQDDSVYVSECGLLTNRVNKYYAKGFQGSLEKIDSLSYSFSNDRGQIGYQRDLYSLGVILLEMMSLQKIQILSTNLLKTQKQNKKQLASLTQQAAKKYGVQIVEFAKCLIKTPLNSKEAYRKMKQNTTQYQPSSVINLKQFENLTYNRGIQQISIMYQKVRQSKKSCQQLLKQFKVYDTQFFFYLTQLYDLQKLLLSPHNIQMQLKGLLEMWDYFTSNSQMRYINIFKEIYDLQELIKNIIILGIQNYDDQKTFFFAQTDGSDFWNIAAIKNFFNLCQIQFQNQQLKTVIHIWNGDQKRDYINFKEFKKLLGQLVQSRVKHHVEPQPAVTIAKYQNDAQQLLLLLKKNVPDQNLFQFFRSNDTRGRWVNDFSIQKQIRSYVKMPEDKMKRCLEAIWNIAIIPSQNKNQRKLRYLILLKQAKQYDPVDLFKLVLTQKINQSDFQNIFEKYRTHEQGWTEQSFMKINEDDLLEFHEREIKQLFRDLDTDKSKVINEKQLIQKLTGLKQFNQAIYIENIRSKVQEKNYQLFQIFMTNDKNKDLQFDTTSELIRSLKQINIEMSQEHAQILFQKYCKRDKCQYIEFLKLFYQIDQLFKSISTFMIKQHFNSDFDKFYNTGLVGKSQKWTKKSIVEINDQLVLGFSTKQIDIIWSKFDKHNDTNLTKQEIAKIFSIKFEKNNFEHQQNQTENYNQKLSKKKKSQERQTKKQQYHTQPPLFRGNSFGKPLEDQKKKVKKDQTLKQKMEQQIEKNQILYDLLKKYKKRQILDYFFEADIEKKFSVSYNEFQSLLKKLQIPYKKSSLQKCLKDYQFKNDQGEPRINFIKLLLYFDTLQEDQAKAKSKTLLSLIRKFIKVRNCSIDDIMNVSRDKNKWYLSSLETFLKKSIDSQIYYDDIQIVWNHWGGNRYLQKSELYEIIFQQKYIQRYNEKKNEQDKLRKPPKKGSTRNQSKKQQQEKYFRKEDQKYKKEKKSFANHQQEQQQETSDNFFKNNKGSTKNRKNQQLSIDPELIHTDKSEQQIRYDKKQKTQKLAPQNNRFKKSVPPISIKSQNLDIERAKQIFINRINKYGIRQLQNAANKKDLIDVGDFKKILYDKYKMDNQAILKITAQLQYSGKVKFQSIKELVRNVTPRSRVAQSPKSRLTQSPKQGNNITSLNNMASSQLIQKKIKLNVPLIKQHIKILISSFAKRFQIRQMGEYMFDKDETIDLDTFQTKCEDINKSISKNMVQQIFNYMNPTKGEITKMSFRLAFNYDQDLQPEGLQFPPELQKQLSEIFSKSDKDRSGTIKKDQLANLLTAIGINITGKQLDSYFNEIDIDGNGYIDYNEFKIFIEKNVFPMIGNFEQIVDYIKRQLKTADIFSTGYLQIEQLRGALQKMGGSFQPNQIISLIRQIGRDNKIQVSQLIKAIIQVSKSKFRNDVKMTLYKIRFLKKISLKEIKNVFSKISSSFSLAYTTQIMRSLEILPSTSIRPKIDSCGLFYNDYFYKNINSIDPNQYCLERSTKYNAFVLQLKLEQATGIPIPLQTLINRNNIIRRHVAISFFDNSQQQIKDSICLMEVLWEDDQEDVWKFTNEKGFERGIYIKIGDYQQQKFDSYSILFQFIITVIENNSLLQINCGSANLIIKQINKIDNVMKKKLEISGGVPSKKKFFKKEDILARRSGWKKLFNSEVESALILEVLPLNKFRDKLPILDILPIRFILNESTIGIVKIFREYFAHNSVSKGKVNPLYANDFKIKAFLFAFDCSQIYTELIPFWNNTIQNKYKSYAQCISWFQELLKELHLIIHHKQFGFMYSCPTYNSMGNKTLYNMRKRLIKQGLQNVANFIKKLPNKKKQIESGIYQPFRIEEIQQAAEDNILLTLNKRNKA